MVDLLASFLLFSQNLVLTLGYPGVFLIAFLENFFPPLPSELIFPFVGFVAGGGKLNLVLVIISGVLGAQAAAFFWYGIGYLLGRANLKLYLDRYGQIFRINFAEIEKAEAWFARYDGQSVFFGRFVPLIRALISVPAGFVRMPIYLFFLYSAAGTTLWIGALSLGGYFLGRRWREIVPLIGNYELAGEILLVAILVVFLIRLARDGAQKSRPR